MHCHIDSTGFGLRNPLQLRTVTAIATAAAFAECQVAALRRLCCVVFLLIDNASVPVCASVSRYQSHRQLSLALAP